MRVFHIRPLAEQRIGFVEKQRARIVDLAIDEPVPVRNLAVMGDMLGTHFDHVIADNRLRADFRKDRMVLDSLDGGETFIRQGDVAEGSTERRARRGSSRNGRCRQSACRPAPSLRRARRGPNVSTPRLMAESRNKPSASTARMISTTRATTRRMITFFIDLVILLRCSLIENAVPCTQIVLWSR